MSKKTEYIYNKNGNIPFTDKDKERLESNPNNHKYINNQKYIKLNKGVLININNYKSPRKDKYKKLFNNADYITTEDITNKIIELAILKGVLTDDDIKDIIDNINTTKTENIEDIKELAKFFSDIKKDKIDDTENTQIIKQPKNKTYPLIGHQLFNGIYQLNKNYNLNNYNRHKDPINIEISIDEDNLNDFSSLPILADLYNNNNQIALLPIDYPLFMAFTQLNNENGGNIPITLEDAFLNIVENKDVRLRKSNKSYKVYTERMLYLDRLKLTYSIVNAKTKEIIGQLKDPTSLLANSRYELNNGKKTAYIIGASAVLTLINDINKLYNIDFMASYKISAEFINDKQNNDIEILNMKYYILPSLLQRVNSKKRLDTNQPLINLDDLYKQTAILKGKTELSIDDKKTLHNQINTFLNHLINKNLISDYSYASDKNRKLSINNLKMQKQRNIKYLKVK